MCCNLVGLPVQPVVRLPARPLARLLVGLEVVFLSRVDERSASFIGYHWDLSSSAIRASAYNVRMLALSLAGRLTGRKKGKSLVLPSFFPSTCL